MDEHDKAMFFSSILAGFLGALGYLSQQEVTRGQKEKVRYLEDCRKRHEHARGEHARGEHARSELPRD